jgi:MerR family transcriptional regulator, light-induced transcriptional regulator
VSTEGLVRIGELSKRTGVSPELLRAWERRYGLLRPTRSDGGLRLYSGGDVDRVKVMQQHLAAGLAAAEAARLATSERGDDTVAARALDPDAARADLAAALDRFDEARAHAVLDRLLAQATIDTLVGEIIVPYLHELGDRWGSGAASVAQEHFASGLLRGRLLGLGRGWGQGVGPLALLACLPGEQHELGLIAFGLLLRARGWRIVYLGPDTPLDTVESLSGELNADLIVLTTLDPRRVTAVSVRLRALARRWLVAVGGTAAADAASKVKGVRPLQRDLVTEAAAVTTASLS